MPARSGGAIPRFLPGPGTYTTRHPPTGARGCRWRKSAGNRRNHPRVKAAIGGGPITRRPAAQADGLRGKSNRARKRASTPGVQIADAAARIAHRHGFNQPQDKAVFDAERHHGFHILIIHPRQQHHIQLDGRQPGRLGGFQPIQHLRLVAASDLGHAFAAQRIQADIHPPTRLPSTARPAAPTGRHWWTPTNRAGPAGPPAARPDPPRPGAARARRRSAAPAGRKPHKRADHPFDFGKRQPVLRLGKVFEPRGCSSCNASRSGR